MYNVLRLQLACHPPGMITESPLIVQKRCVTGSLRCLQISSRMILLCLKPPMQLLLRTLAVQYKTSQFSQSYIMNKKRLSYSIFFLLPKPIAGNFAPAGYLLNVKLPHLGRIRSCCVLHCVMKHMVQDDMVLKYFFKNTEML